MERIRHNPLQLRRSHIHTTASTKKRRKSPCLTSHPASHIPPAQHQHTAAHTVSAQIPFTHSSQHAAGLRSTFTPSTPVRPIHAPYPSSSSSYITPASTASHLLPPYSTSSLPTLSALSLVPPPHSSLATAAPFPTPAKAKLNTYLVELVKNSIRITDEFSAMCRTKVAEKDAVIAGLREEIERFECESGGHTDD